MLGFAMSGGGGGGGAKVTVRWQDQERINAYGRLTSRKREIEVELQEAEEQIKTLDDASTVVALEAEGLKYRIGDCCVEVDGEEAEAMLAEEQRQAREKLEALQKELTGAKATLAELKVELIRHFGDAIGLDK